MSASTPLASPRFASYLSDAIGGALGIADDLRGAPHEVGLASCAGYLLQRDPTLARLGRSASLSALRRAGPAMAQARPERWHSVVEHQLRPLALLAAEQVRGTGLIDQTQSDALVARLPEAISASYRGEASGDLWTATEAIARLDEARTTIEQARGGGEVITATRRRAAEQIEGMTEWMAQHLAGLLASPPGRSELGRTLPDVIWREAIADALVTPEAIRLTDELHSDGYLESHRAAVRELVGEPLGRPVIVLGDDLWFREMAPGRSDPLGVHVRKLAILLSRRIGGEAEEQKRVPRLNATVVHELIHATQRDRHGPLRKPPYTALTGDVERKFLEGMTEYFTGRVLDRAGSRWKGADNPYSAREGRGGHYYAYGFVCVAAISLAYPKTTPDDALLEFSYNPHKLTNLCRLLTGEYTAERKDELARLLEGIFTLAESLSQEPRRVEYELRQHCQEELQEYARRQSDGPGMSGSSHMGASTGASSGERA